MQNFLHLNSLVWSINNKKKNISSRPSWGKQTIIGINKNSKFVGEIEWVDPNKYNTTKAQFFVSYHRFFLKDFQQTCHWVGNSLMKIIDDDEFMKKKEYNEIKQSWRSRNRDGCRSGANVDRRVGIRIPASTLTMAWLPCQTPAGSRVNLTPWSDYLIGRACWPMSGRQSTWSAAPTRRGGISCRRRTRYGSLWRGTPTGSNRRDGFTAGIVGRRWRWDIWRVTWWLSMGGWQRRDGVGEPRPRGNGHGHSKWPSRPREARGAARWRDVWAERRQGRRCGYTFCTGMSWTPWSSWRKETSSTHSAPNATC